MAGIMVETVTEYGSTILRLVHDGKIIDIMEVDNIVFFGDENVLRSSPEFEEKACADIWEGENHV